MSAGAGTAVPQAELVELAVDQVAQDIALFASREIAVEGMQVEYSEERVAGAECIHLSFKLAFEQDDEQRLGCLLVPLPDAISVAAFLMLKQDEEVVAMRELSDLDDGLKDAMLEIANLVGGALDNALRWFLPSGCRVRSAGCQGVRTGARPHLPGPADLAYLVARAETRVDRFKPAEWILMIPDVFADGVGSAGGRPPEPEQAPAAETGGAGDGPEEAPEASDGASI